MDWDGNLLKLKGHVFHVDPDGDVRKTPPMVEAIYEVCAPIEPKRILELGTASGASAVLWRELFQADKLVTIDRAKEPLELPGIRTYRGLDQADADALREIVRVEFDSLDLVIDDASHFYEPTRASFDVLFPLLRPGGLYVLEDWDWEVLNRLADPPLFGGAEGLVRLVAEVSRRVGRDVGSVSLHRSFAVVERA
jgi:predicted O-methyltransferase YrrM